jgi:hypothetical protein
MTAFLQGSQSRDRIAVVDNDSQETFEKSLNTVFSEIAPAYLTIKYQETLS